MEYKGLKIHQDELKKDKPLKYIYNNQKEILKKFVKFITPYLKSRPFFNKVWVWGSLAKGKFGIYKTPYNNQEGSDVDLLVEVDESFSIPSEFKEIKEWTKTRTYSRLFTSSLVFVNKFSAKKSVKHKIDFICHFPSKNTKDGFYNKTRESKLIYKK